MKQNIDKLFKNFIGNTLSEKEYRTLMAFIKNPNTKNDVVEMINTHLKEVDGHEKHYKKRSSSESERLYLKIMSRIGDDVKAEKKTFTNKISNTGKLILLTTAFVVMAGLFFSYQKEIFNTNQTAGYDSDILAVENVILTLDDGTLKVMSENGHLNIISSKGMLIGAQNGNQLNYQNTEMSEELVYNTLSVPYGKQFDLLLSDGSQVKLNAGSSIRYPVRFIEREPRKVFLEGEAYFDIAKEEDHPFIVNANNINVQVLGTQFNISYYPEDKVISTVLVEGSVKLYTEGSGNAGREAIVLTPGYLAAWDKTTQEVSVKKVDTHIYTAWKDGTLLFKNSSFKNIRMKLERHFNITIDNSYTFLEDQMYTASFTTENLSEILEAFKEDTPFEFKIDTDKISITNQIMNNINHPSQ
ncbi:MAG: FecR domain-containing protein [Flavobacteriaceae bacterium]